MKKIMMIAILLIGFGCITGCKKQEEQNTDAIKFKEEYEKLNGVANASGLKHRDITIDKNNPFIFTTAEDIVKKIENKETFYLYVGDKQCPWCRSVIESAIEVANKENIKTIYYVSIWDDDHNEILRDVYKLNDKNKPELVSKGTDAYYKLMESFNDLLRDYTLTDQKGKTVEVGEKRIFAPNFIYVENGVAKKLTNAKSELQTDSRMDLTEEMKKEQKEKLVDFFRN